MRVFKNLVLFVLVSTSLETIASPLCLEKPKFFASVFEYECELFTDSACFSHSTKLTDYIDIEKFSAEFEVDIKNQNDNTTKCLLVNANVMFTDLVTTFLHCDEGYGRVKVTAKFECQRF
jgi:hypothetical protein